MTDDLAAEGDLPDRIRSEAAIADRPGQLARLEAIADEVAAALRIRDELAAECERHRRANLIRAVTQGFDGWVTDAINDGTFDAVPWRMADALRVRAETAEALLAEVNQRAIYPGGADLRVRVATAVEARP